MFLIGRDCTHAPVASRPRPKTWPLASPAWRAGRHPVTTRSRPVQSDRAARPLKTGLVRRYQKHRLKTAELATTRGSGCEATGAGKVLSFAGSPKRIFATDGPPSSVQVSIGRTTSHASSPRRSYCRWLSKTVFSARANRASASCKIRDSPIARSRSSLVKTSTPSLSACSMSAFTSSRASGVTIKGIMRRWLWPDSSSLRRKLIARS